ncbi:MAG: hypothetical protein PVF51_10860 [Nitrospirota bacterium]
MKITKSLVASLLLGPLGMVPLAQSAPPLVEPVDVTVVNEAPVPVTEQDRGYVSHQFVGYTTAETEADIGIGGMTELCQAEIPDSRICSTREILESRDPTPPVQSPTSWVLGEYEIMPNPASTTSPFLWREKYSGNGDTVTDLLTALRTGCEQMISPSSSYETVVYGGATGIFFRTTCNGTRPVACCAPRFVPAGP